MLAVAEARARGLKLIAGALAERVSFISNTLYLQILLRCVFNINFGKMVDIRLYLTWCLRMDHHIFCGE